MSALTLPRVPRCGDIRAGFLPFLTLGKGTFKAVAPSYRVDIPSAPCGHPQSAVPIHNLCNLPLVRLVANSVLGGVCTSTEDLDD